MTPYYEIEKRDVCNLTVLTSMGVCRVAESAGTVRAEAAQPMKMADLDGSPVRPVLIEI